MEHAVAGSKQRESRGTVDRGLYTEDTQSLCPT